MRAACSVDTSAGEAFRLLLLDLGVHGIFTTQLRMCEAGAHH
jgi:hypothetical protein